VSNSSRRKKGKKLSVADCALRPFKSPLKKPLWHQERDEKKRGFRGGGKNLSPEGLLTCAIERRKKIPQGRTYGEKFEEYGIPNCKKKKKSPPGGKRISFPESRPKKKKRGHRIKGGTAVHQEKKEPVSLKAKKTA